MDLSGMLSGLTGNNGGGANPPPVNPSASATNKPKAGGSTPQIAIPGDKYNDAPKIDASAEKIGTDAERVRAKQTNELIRINTNMLNVLRNIHEFNKETLRSQNMALKIASIESSGGGDATSTSSRSTTGGGGIGSALLMGAIAGGIFPAILGLGKAFEGFTKFLNNLMPKDGGDTPRNAVRNLEALQSSTITGAQAGASFATRAIPRYAANAAQDTRGAGMVGLAREEARATGRSTLSVLSETEGGKGAALKTLTRTAMQKLEGPVLKSLRSIANFLKSYKGQALIASVLALVEMGITIYEMSSTGQPIEIKPLAKELTKVIISCLTSYATGTIIGALCGSVVPLLGTVVGAFVGFLASVAIGVALGPIIESVSEHIANWIFGIETGEEAAASIKKETASYVTSVATAVSPTGASYASATYGKVTDFLGGGNIAKGVGAAAAFQAYGVGVGAGALTSASDYLFGTKTNDAIQLSAPAAGGGGREDRASSGAGGSAVEAKMTPGQKGNAQSAMAYLMSKGGLTKEQAAGIVGNLMGESQLDPNSKGDKNGRGEYTAHGIAQWHGDRWNPFLEWAKKNGKNPYTVEAQLDWVLIELGSTEKRAGNLLKNAKTAQEATDIIMNNYERPSQSLRAGESKRRGGLAMAALSAMGNATADQQTAGRDDRSSSSAGGGRDDRSASPQSPKVDTAAKISPPSSGGRDDRSGGASGSAGGAGGAAGAQAMSMPSNQSIPSPAASKGGVDLLWYFGAAA